MKNKKMGCLVLIVLLAIIGVGVWSIVGGGSKSNEPTSAKDAIPALSALVESNVEKTEMFL